MKNKKINKIIRRLIAVFLAVLIAAGIVLSQSSDRVLKATALPDTADTKSLAAEVPEETLTMEDAVLNLPAGGDTEEPSAEENESSPEESSQEETTAPEESTLVQEIPSEAGSVTEAEPESESVQSEEAETEETAQPEESSTSEQAPESESADTEEQSTPEETSAPEEEQEKIYTIIFKNADGSELLKREIRENEKIEVLPMDPFKDGYAFVRWEDEEGNEITKQTEVTSDLVAAPVFELIDIFTITVDYFYTDSQGNYQNIDRTVVTVDSRTVTAESPVQIESPPQYQIRDDGGVLAGEIYYPATQTIRIFPEDLADAAETKQIERSVEYSTQAVSYSCIYMLKDLDGDGYSEIERTMGNAVVGSLVTPEIRNYDYADFEMTEPYQIKGDGDELFVYYTRKNFSLIYDSEGGTAVSPVVAPYGSRITLSDAPVRTGYEFTGWYMDEALTSRAAAITLERNVTLYAGWKAKTVGYTIVYMKEKYDNATGSTYYVYDNSRSVSAVVGTTITANDKDIPKLTSNVNGYEADPARNAASSVKIAADGSSVLTVYYSLIRYTLVFNINNNNGRITMGGQTYSGSSYQISNVVLGQDISSMWPSSSNEIYSTRSKNYFSGWTGASGTYITRRYEVIWDNVANAKNKVMTFKAGWSTSSASRNAEYWLQQPDGTYKVEDEFTQIGINTTNLGAKDLDGYTKHSGTPSGYNGSGMSGGVYTYRFYYDRNSYNIDYYDGGTALASKKSILFGADISGADYNFTPDKPAGKEDYTWGGWFSDSALSNPFSFTAMPGNNVALYADWIPPKYKVSFHNNYEGAEDILSTQTVNRNAAAEDPGNPVRANYRFTGWFTERDGGRQYLAGSEPVTDDIDLYAHWEIIPLKYTVKYIDKSTGKTLFTRKTVENPSFTPGQQITEDAAVIAGYIPYDSKKSINLDFDPARNEIIFEYETKSDRKLKYTVQYVLLDDPAIHVAQDKHVQVAGTYASITETAAPVTVSEYASYRPAALTGVLQLGLNSSTNVLTFYYIPDGAGVTVRWLDMDGQPIPGRAQSISHYVVGSHFDIDTEINGYRLHHITDNINGSGGASYYVYENVDIIVNVYMQKSLTITAASRSKVYDGAALENSGTADVTVNGLESGHILESVAFAGSITDAGTVQSVPENAVINGPESSEYYDITYVPGTLAVSKVPVIINVEPDRWNDGKAYDGTARTIGFRNLRGNPEGRDGVVINNYAYEAEYGMVIRDMVRDITFTATDAGTYKIPAADIRAAITLPEDGNYDVTLNIRDGELTIPKAPLLIRTGSAERVYDGNALTNDEVTIEGLAEDEEIKVTVTGSQTTAGSSDNSFNVEWGDVNEDNYECTFIPGTLTVNDREVKYEINLVPEGASGKYDGTEKHAEGFKELEFNIEGNTYTVSEVSAGVSAVNAGTYPVEIEGTPLVKDASGNDVTEQFRVTFADAELNIAKRDVILTSADASAQYSGDALTNDEITVTGDGFAEGEGAAYDVTGGQTLPGASGNEFTYMLLPGTLEDNYNVSTVFGTLSVTNREALYEITVQAADASFVYDGSEHETNEITGLSQQINGHLYQVSGLSAYGAGMHAGTYGVNITGTPMVSDENGNDVTEQFAVRCESGTISIRPRKVTIISADAVKEYDGTALTGEDSAEAGYSIAGEGFAEGEGVNIAFGAGRTLVGESENRFIWTLDENTLERDYEIEPVYGLLKVTDRGADSLYPVIVTASSGRFTYDGSEHTVSGITGTSAGFNGVVYTVEGLSAEASAVNAGTYEVRISGTPKVTDPEGNDVTAQFNVVLAAGTMEIEKRNVALKSASVSREYDGMPLTAESVIEGGEGFAEGEGASYTVRGSQLLPGSSENTFTYTLNGGTDAGNYNISLEPGELTVKDRTEKYVLNVNAGSDRVLYDGSEHSISEISLADGTKAFEDGTLAFEQEGISYTLSGLSVSASGVDAGRYEAAVTGEALVNDSSGNDVTSQFDVRTSDGVLEIARRNITLSTPTDSKEYDGNALTAGPVAVSGDGFADGEGAGYDITGSQLIAGSSDNTFTYTLNEGTRAENYNIVTSEGRLTVNSRTSRYSVDVSGASANVVYDGSEHAVSSLVCLQQIAAEDGKISLMIDGNTYTLSGLSASASGTDAGSYSVNVTGTAVITDSQGNDVTDQFAVNVSSGSLEIEKASLDTGAVSADKKYDGRALRGGYTGTIPESAAVSYSTDDGESWSSEAPGQLGAGTCFYMVRIEDANYETAYASGTLTVSPRNITITSSSSQKEYDGIALSDENFRISGDGFAEDEDITVAFTGSQLLPGAGSNTFTYEFTEGADAANYQVNVIFGSLNVTSREAKYQIAVQAEDHTVTYDGEEKSARGIVTDTFTVDGNVYTVSGMNASGMGTNAGKYEIPVTGTALVRDAAGNDVTGEFAVMVQSGTLTIEPRKVTLTSPSASREYDGTALSCSGPVEVTGEGFAGEDGVNITMTGSRTVTGSSDNTFTYEFHTGSAENYNISTEYGTLTVVPRGSGDLFVIRAKAISSEAVYDGSEHSISGLVNDTFTVNGVIYTLEGLSASVSGTDAGTYASVITGSAVVKDAAGNDVTDQFRIIPEDGTLVINKRDVALFSSSMSREYDGSPLTAADIRIGGAGFAEGEGATFNVTGSQLIAGSSPNTFTYALTARTKPANYNISVHPGVLTVTNRAAKYEITVEANSALGKYDGSTWHAEGLVTDTFEIGGNTYTVEGLSASVSASDAGTYPVMITGTPIVRDAAGNDVTEEFIVNIRDGVLEIAKRKITFTSASASKEYDGNMLRAESVEVTGEGFAAGEGAEFSFSEGITTVGFIRNFFSWAMKEGTNADNYDVTVNEGGLTVYNRRARFEIEVVPVSAEYTYDGQPHSAEGLVSCRFGIGNNIYTIEGLDAARSEVHAGEYSVGVMGTAVVRDASGNDVSDQFRVIAREGRLKINPRHVTLISASAQRPYNGFTLTEGNYEVSGDGFVQGEGVSVTSTGRQLLPGASENTFAYSFNEGTDANDYVVNTVFGSLTVMNRQGDDLYEVTVEAPSGRYLYDGELHSVGGISIAGSEPSEEVTFEAGGNTYTLSGMSALADAVNAGTYPVNVTGCAIVTDIQGNDVTSQFAVSTSSGVLEIEKRRVILTSGSAAHAYTGRKVKNESVEVSGDGFAKGEGAVFTVTGARTIVGLSENEFTYRLSDGTLEENYEISSVFGTLTVTGRDAKYAVTLEMNSAEFVYDGTEKSVAGFKSLRFMADEAEYTVDGLEAFAAATETGEYAVSASGQPVVYDSEGNDVTDQFAINVIPGVLKIRAAELTGAEEDGGHTLVIEYVDEAGNEVAESYVAEYIPGEEIGPVISPEVAGMTPDYDEIVSLPSGMPDQDAVVQVVYSPEEAVKETSIYDEPAHSGALSINSNTGDVILTDITDSNVPLAQAAKAGYWALLNLLLAAATVLGFVLLIIIFVLGRKKETDDSKDTEKSVDGAEGSQYNDKSTSKRRSRIWFIAGAFMAIGAVIAFLLTEDMTNSMRFVDIWTILMAVIFALQALVLVFNRARKSDGEDEES